MYPQVQNRRFKIENEIRPFILKNNIYFTIH
eukprot:SAG31_NODE_25473_length_460_cov_2.584488_1_plen_30_part_10